MRSRFILYLIVLLLGFPAWARSDRSHDRGFADGVLGIPRDGQGWRPELPAYMPPSEQLSAVAMEPVMPGKPSDDGEKFREGDSCVILGYTDQKGNTTDHNSAMTAANLYWFGVKARLQAKWKPYPRIFRVTTVDQLFEALTKCPPGADINIDTHGFGGEHGGGFCVGEDECIPAWDKEKVAKFVEAAATKAPRSIWLNACLVAEGVKDSKLGNDEAIDKNFGNLIANGVHEAMVRNAIAKAAEKGTKVEGIKPVRVHAFTTSIYSDQKNGPISMEKETVRVTFEADPAVQRDATRKIADHNASLVRATYFTNLPGRLLPEEPSGRPRPEWPPAGTDWPPFKPPPQPPLIGWDPLQPQRPIEWPPLEPKFPIGWEPLRPDPSPWFPKPPSDEFRDWFKRREPQFEPGWVQSLLREASLK